MINKTSIKAYSKTTRAKLILLLLFISFFATGQNRISKIVKDINFNSQPASSLFRAIPQSSLQGNSDDMGMLLLADSLSVAEIIKKTPSKLSLYIPGQDIIVDLLFDNYRSSNEIKIVTSQNEKITYSTPKTYSGVVRDKESSLVSLTFAVQGISGFISDSDKTISLNYTDCPYEVLISNFIADRFKCSTVDDINQQVANLQQVSTQNHIACRAVEIYFEADYSIFQHFGSVPLVVDYVNNLFNQVATIYANEGIEIVISQIKVWDTPDPYINYDNTLEYLHQFSYNMNNYGFYGDLAHILSFRNIGGGRATLNTLHNKGAGVSGNLENSVIAFPDYSSNVMLVAHELGHNFGSPHTHSCSWPEGPLDNCAAPEGSCSPLPPGNYQQTIMSYCGNYNLSNGFGILPGNLIRSRTAAFLGSSAIPDNISVSESTSNQAFLNWGTNLSKTTYIVEYKNKTAVNWTQLTTAQNQVVLSGLLPNTTYIWRVKALCSDFSAIHEFTTTADANYCFPNFTVDNCTIAANINQVLLDGFSLSGPSGCSAGSYFTNPGKVRNLVPGQTYSLSIRFEKDAYDMRTSVWIDYNDNHIFEPAEMLFSQMTGFSLNLTSNFTVPANSTPVSSVRMRIVTTFGTSELSSCGNHLLGETEDYFVAIADCQSPNPPINLSADSVTTSSANLNWEAPEEFFYVGFKKLSENLWTEKLATTSTTLLSELTPNTPYEVRVKSTCSNYTTLVFTTQSEEYCSPHFTNPEVCTTAGTGIKQFKIIGTNLDNNSGCSSTGYSIFDNQIVNLTPGLSYTFLFEVMSTPIIPAAVWIDMNGNGVFERSERIFYSPVITNVVNSFSFTLPDSLVFIERTRIRIAYGYFVTEDPCNEGYSGETEDYVISIKKSCGQLTTNNFSTIAATPCKNAQISFAVNLNNGEKGVLSYSFNGILLTDSFMVKNNRVYINISDPGTYSLQSLQYGTCVVSLGYTTLISELIDAFSTPEIFERCGSGNLVLTSDGCNSGEVEWYTNLADFSPVHIGSSFQTPHLTANKTYYVRCKTASCATLKQPIDIRININLTFDSIIHSSNSHIKTQNTITSRAKVTDTGRYSAGNSVTLLPGFEISKGKMFEAKIEGCE
jgi:hypothetical protein